MSDRFDEHRDTLEDRTRVASVQPGQLLGERYTLGDLLARRGGTLTWRAFDNVLSRQVLVHMLAPHDPRNDGILLAARRAAAATDSRFLRVLDAVESPHPNEGSYIVCEYATGYSLQEILGRTALSALESAWIVKEVSEALSGVHAQGLYHRRINPDSIIITSTGNVKIVGFLIDYALDPAQGSAENGEASDVVALGALLYACLVQKWIFGPGYGLGGAPTDQVGVLLPRQVRAGIAPALDEVVDRIISDPPRGRYRELASAYEISIALNRILAGADASGELEHRLRGPSSHPAPPALRRGGTPPSMPSPATSTLSVRTADPPPRPRKAPETQLPLRSLFLGGLVLIMILLFVFLAIRKMAEETPLAQYSQPPIPTETGDSQATRSLRIVQAYDFDPEGTNSETPAELPLLFDGKDNTAWHTETYESADFGGKKTGVGVIVDLGSAQDVTRVTLQVGTTPLDFVIMVPRGEAKKVPRDSMEQWAEMASQKNAGTTPEVALSQTTRTQFVLVWLTKLPPKKGGGFQAAINEIRVY